MKLLTLILSLFMSCNIQSMDVFEMGGKRISALGLKGEIKIGDLIKIKKQLILSEKLPDMVIISSNGGSIIEAIKIGNLFKQLSVTVLATIQCNSSCFLILAGAAERILNVDIGLHRPYFTKSYNSNLSQKESETQYKTARIETRDYLKSMNIPTRYIDIMMATPSTDIYYLSKNEFKHNIGLIQPAIYEWVNSKCDALNKIEETDHNNIIAEIIVSTNMLNIVAHNSGEKLLSKNDYQSTKLLIESSLIDGAKAELLPQKYKKYLNKKQALFQRCKKNALSTKRKYVLDEIKKELSHKPISNPNYYTLEDFGMTDEVK